MPKLALVALNIRSAHNIGSLLRTAEGLGIAEVVIAGLSPYPMLEKDPRLPHIAKRAHDQIHKTALGAEHTLKWQYLATFKEVCQWAASCGYRLAAVEQTAEAIPLPEFRVNEDTALILGNEVQGLDEDILKKVPDHIVIPMHGKKESFNVAVAGAIAMYDLKLKCDGHN